MKRLLIILLISFPTISYAREADSLLTDTGIHFQNGLSWDQIKEKAKVENKFIFLDCYATWCGPCKFMAEKVFTRTAVAGYFNKHFINVEIQMDKTAKDDDYVRSWYSKIAEFTKLYKIDAYPTFLFFDSNGRPLHKSIGATGEDGNEFVLIGRDALDPQKQYYTLLNNFKFHKKDSTYLRNAIVASIKLHDAIATDQLCNVYLDCGINPYTETNFSLIEKGVNSSSDQTFHFIIQNRTKINGLLGSDRADGDLRTIITEEEISPIYSKNASPPNWIRLSNRLKLKYPSLYDRVISEAKLDYFKYKNDWPHYGKAFITYINKYGVQLSSFQLNDLTWTIFLNVNDKLTIRDAVAWSRRMLDNLDSTEKDNPISNYQNYLDTYANLLYKSGDKPNALKYEKQALKIAESGSREDKIKGYKATIAAMETGRITW